MVCTESLTLPLTLLTDELSLCSILGQLLTMLVNTPQAMASLTLTVNSGFALTTVNTVNKWRNSWFFKRTLVDGDR
jgi:hypothetical protein